MTFEPPDAPEMPEIEPGDEVGFHRMERIEYGTVVVAIGSWFSVRTQYGRLLVKKEDVVEWNKS